MIGLKYMYQVIVMYGDDEPWWFLDGWKEDIKETQAFSTFEAAFEVYQQKKSQFCKEFQTNREKETFLMAFWNEGETRFCEECDDDLQQYKGLMLLKEGSPLSIDGKEEYETTYNSRKTQCCKRSSQGTWSNQKNEKLH